MKKRMFNRLMSAMIASVILLTTICVPAFAEESAAGGRYVSEVFIAYGKKQADAVKWLTDNGYEPISGENDFCAGKASYWDTSISAAMGIKRTNQAEDAITDMAVMNMTGGYSFPAYEDILKQKKSDIEEMIRYLMDIINEYRDNYNGKGSRFGRLRAVLAHDILNRFYDGETDGKYAVNDTGMKLGDLFLAPMRHEDGGENGGDLNQILLESSGPAMLTVEILLSFAADKEKTTWLDRLSELSEDTFAEKIGEYIPSAAGQNLAPSALQNLLKQAYGEVAETLSSEWPEIHEKMRWFEEYQDRNDLWQKDDEDDSAFNKRLNKHFIALRNEDPDHFEEMMHEYEYNSILYSSVYAVPYAGGWGETLGDFFNPADSEYRNPDADSFLPLAAVLSNGQRASLEYVSLSSLIMAGTQSEQALQKALPDINSILGDNLTLSVYAGVNRDIFRNGVAITSEALMEQNMGRANAYNRMWDTTGIVFTTAICSAVAGFIAIIAGGCLISKGSKLASALAPADQVKSWQQHVTDIKKKFAFDTFRDARDQAFYSNELSGYETDLWDYNNASSRAAKVKADGQVLMGIGGGLLILAATLTSMQLYKYYQRTFTPIPRMIVSESDIVTYLKDENGKPVLDEKGNQKKLIEFKDYEYYEAVKCNRPDVGKISDWQDGVSDYKDHGCADVADLNGDYGQEWLALYTVKSPNKGKPILADSLKLQYGSDKQPKGTTKSLHFFSYTYAMDMGDTAYSFNNKKDGVFFFWDEDAKAGSGQAASAFTGGQLAMAGVGGLIVGILAATLILLRKRKKQNA